MKKRIKRLQGSSYIVSQEPQDFLGKGSFGKVVRAYDLDNRDEQLVAKIMEIGTQAKRDCLEQELQILEKLNSQHQNLVGYKRQKLYSTKACYIIMEYCNGGTLEEKMQGKLFSEVEAYDFLCQFCSGYRELYRQHIIHRDLKPANIMIHDRLYKITDFGLAKIIDTLDDKLSISFKGTPLYMAPEMIQEEGAADAKIDMWALGVILYRMLYKSFPFLVANKKYDKESAFEAIVKNPLKIPPFPKRSAQLVNLLQRMLNKNPKDRISWEEMFQHHQILPHLDEVKLAQKPQGQMLNSSVFIQQLVTQKVSLIKVQPFKNSSKPIKPVIEQVLTQESLTKIVQLDENEQKHLISQLIKEMDLKLVQNRNLLDIEDKLLYVRERIILLDKTALRVQRLQLEIDPQVLVNVSLDLISQALKLMGSILKLAPLTPEEAEAYKASVNFQVVAAMLNEDLQGLQDFKDDLTRRLQKEIHNAAYQLKTLVKANANTHTRQTYVALKYLCDCYNFEGLKLKQFDDFQFYYENVESCTEEEAAELILQIL